MEDRNKLVDKLRYIANQIERNKLDYRYACDRIILEDLYDECQEHFNNFLKIVLRQILSYFGILGVNNV